MIARRTPTQALTGQLRRFSDAKRFELRASRDDHARMVQAWDEWSDIDELAIAIIEAVEDDGADDDFTVYALDGDGSELGCTTTWRGEASAIVVRPAVEVAKPKYDSPEPEANVVRFMGRLMGHLETMSRFALQREEALSEDNARLREFASRVTRTQLENIEIQERLLSQAEDRELKRKQSREHMKLAGELVSDIKPLVPIVLNSLIGKKLLNENEQSSLATLLATLDNNQIAALLSILKPGQRAALQKLIDAAEPPEDEEDGKASH